jgi:hypothetical protein
MVTFATFLFNCVRLGTYLLSMNCGSFALHGLFEILQFLQMFADLLSVYPHRSQDSSAGTGTRSWGG